MLLGNSLSPSESKSIHKFGLEGLLEDGERVALIEGPQIWRSIVTKIQTSLRLLDRALPGMNQLFGIAASDTRSFSGLDTPRMRRLRYLDGYFADIEAFEFFSREISRLTASLDDLSQHLPSDDVGHFDVALHVRLGDYRLQAQSWIISFERLARAAMDLSGLTHPTVVVFSDEPEAALLGLTEAFPQVDWVTAPASRGALPTLLSMASASKLVCSRSTFSWWAGRIITSRGGEVFFPVTETQKSSEVISCPSSWKYF